MVKRIALIGSLAAAVIVIALFAGRTLLPPVVDVTKPVRGPAVQAVYATGTVEATVMLPIAARSGARLVELNADEGSKVKKDEVMAQLESDDLLGSLKELQARELNAKLDYERKAKLLESGYATKEASDQAKADWDAAKAAVSRAQSQINFMKLVAPANGTVIRRDGEVGELIPANQPVFWLSCCAPLRVSTEVNEEDIALVQPGQKVLIHADAFPDKVFEGTVQSITPKGDPIARSYRVRVALPEETPLMIGMTAETNIIVGEDENALLVPSTALRKGNIWVVRDGRLAEQDVEAGAIGTTQTQIKAGIGDDDVIVVNPGEALEDGARTRTNMTEQKQP
ncbi:MAG: efflux RND transporter periplasmic adaptor subunit [Alphaproteobacteria bacterium]|nr:efflux RND transporter periplasmic adaptor subunit [Alphaproteobacteria bacterium]